MVVRYTGDKDSINQLVVATSRCFDSEKACLNYIAAQIAEIDLKIDLAIVEIMRIYGHAVRASAVAGLIPGTSTTTSWTVSSFVCRKILKCFGVSSLGHKTLNDIIRRLLWDNMDTSALVIFTETISMLGLIGTTSVFGAPNSLATGVLGFAVSVPATARLVLMFACDVILIIIRAFDLCKSKCINQPERVQIETATHEYKDTMPVVHRRVKELVTRVGGLVTSFRSSKIKPRVEAIIEEFKGPRSKSVAGKLSVDKYADADRGIVLEK